MVFLGWVLENEYGALAQRCARLWGRYYRQLPAICPQVRIFKANAPTPPA